MQNPQEYKGKESELNVEITYRIRVNNIANAADLRESVVENGKTQIKPVDVKLNTKIHEITDLYDMNNVKKIKLENVILFTINREVNREF